MGSLIVVTGPPGAGKSTVAELVVGHFEPSALVAGDAFFGFLRRGAITPWTTPARAQNETVTRASAAAAGHLVRGGLTTVYEGIIGPWMLPAFLDGLDLPSLDYVMLLPPADECARRVATREGHGFTDEAVTRVLHEQFASSQIAPRHVLRDSTADAREIAALIAERVAEGSLRYPSRSR